MYGVITYGITENGLENTRFTAERVAISSKLIINTFLHFYGQVAYFLNPA